MIPYLKEAIGNLFKPSVTSKFPEKPVETPKNYRGIFTRGRSEE